MVDETLEGVRRRMAKNLPGWMMGSHQRIVSFGEKKITLCGDPKDSYFAGVAVDEPLHFAASQLPKHAVVVDVGSNIGLTSAALAASGALVIHSFEPDPAAFAYLQKTIDANNLRNVINPHQLALGETPGSLTLFSNSTSASASHLVCGDTLGQTGGVMVVVSTLDAVTKDFDRLDLIKIDVEGFEIDVLRGGAATLKRLRPSLLIEFNSFTMIGFRDVNPRDLLRNLRSTFPFVHWFQDGKPRLIEADSDELTFLHKHLVSPGCVDDLYCSFTRPVSYACG